jgi:uncharacterized membrane protein YecN with MAPEG domain
LETEVLVPFAKATTKQVLPTVSMKQSCRELFEQSAPFAFFLIFLAELNGAPTSLVHGAFSTLFLARVAHGSFGVVTDNTVGIGRPIGIIGTYTVTFLAGLYNVSCAGKTLPCFAGVCHR